MDTPLSDDDVVFSHDPLDIVEHVLEAENLEFDRNERGDLTFVLSGDWRDFDLWFSWRAEVECLQVLLAIDLTFEPGQKGEALELINIINAKTSLGHFEIWEDGSIIFRHGMALPAGDSPSLAQTAAMIDAAMEAADRFFPAFDFLIRGGKSASAAMAACMFDTVGEA